MAIRDELDAITMGFREAFATQDAARLAAIYADDARRRSSCSARASGKAA